MRKTLSKSLLLLVFAVCLCCIVYPVALWIVGRVFFPFKASGSIVMDSSGKPVGSYLIAQPFTNDAYFFPRPSACSYDASASSSSALAASNYALRDRVAKQLGPLVCYKEGPKANQLASPDIEAWFQKDTFRKAPHIVSQWANEHPALAKAWVSQSAIRQAYVDNWAKEHKAEVDEFIRQNPDITTPKAPDLAVVFFTNFSEKNPGKFLTEVSQTNAQGKIEASIQEINTGTDIQSTFFDMWRQDHPDIALEEVPADFVMSSASGLDPHITLQNAEYQLERVAKSWAQLLKRDQSDVEAEIRKILSEHASAPFLGLIGEKFVNVLEINLELKKRYGAPL